MAQTPQPVSQTQWDNALEALYREAVLVQERIRLIIRLREIDLERLGIQVAPMQQAAVEPRTVKATTPGQAQDKAPAPAGGDGKAVDLPTLLETISQQVNRPLKMADFIPLVRGPGTRRRLRTSATWCTRRSSSWSGVAR